MSWIQDLIQKLKKEDEIEFDEPFLHNDKPEGLLIHNNSSSVKDMDARISYQYPKTSLRSSPIDQTSEPRIPSARQERLSRRKSLDLAAIEIVQEPIFPMETSSKKEPVSHKEPTPQKEKTIEKEPVSKRRGPFHPTEIPSPVFGFNRPKKQAPVIEHELGDFLKKDTSRIEESLLKPERLRKADEREPVVSNSPSKRHAEADSAAVTANHDSVILAAALDSGDSGMAKEKTIANNIVAIENDMEPANSIASMENDLKADRNEEHIDARAIIKTIMESPIQSVETDTAHAAAETVPAENHTYFVETPEVPEEKEDAPEHSGQHQEQPDEAEKKPRRSHLPFNVLMLKQDRESWAVRKDKQLQDVKKEPAAASNHSAGVPVSKSQPDMIRHLEQKSNPGLFQFPEPSLLTPPIMKPGDTEWLAYQQDILNQTLQNFNVGASVVNVTQGPSVTRFEVQPEPGVKVNKITNLSDDIKLSLAARDIRMEAPIPGKHTIGIEVPNKKARPVFISEIIESSAFRNSPSPLTAVLGLDIAGSPIVTDLKKMPHGLIAGATGSGKSVCINSILVSLLYKATPDELKLLLIDPKMVELAPYNRIPHLVSPVITDVKAATAALKWAVDEMERRYELFAHTGVRDINRFNELAVEHKQYADKLPYIVIVIDELADLMMMSPADVEEAICRIAQKARACGIHLIVATQRPSVDVITGLIKANIPTRIAFSVSSQVDSRTIIDISGAEKLLGRGDMLFLENGSSKPVRLQGTFVSDEEIDRITDHARGQREPDYLFEQEELLKKTQATSDEDELFYDACEFIIDQGGASTSSLQRRFKIGYNRAARLMDMLEDNGYISGANGSKPREVLITEAELESIQDSMLHS
nr:DNA translocase FtsK [Neobacillus muris]